MPFHIYGTEFWVKYVPIIREILEGTYLIAGLLGVLSKHLTISIVVIADAYEPIFVCYAAVTLVSKVATFANRIGPKKP